jgi:hypothetical protein
MISFCTQGLFRKVTGHQLILAVRRRCIIVSIFNVSLGTAAAFIAVSNKLWSPLLSFCIGTTLGTFGSYRIASFSTLTIAGQNLVLSFKVLCLNFAFKYFASRVLLKLSLLREFYFKFSCRLQRLKIYTVTSFEVGSYFVTSY